MAFKKIKSYNMTETQLRDLWKTEYCNWKQNPIHTFDNVLVKFYDNNFDHAFMESDNWKKKDKSLLSLNRCEKMLWIKDTLQSSDAIIKQGWNKKNSSYSNKRRASIIKNNYIVIIEFIRINEAKFITAFENNDNENLEKMKKGPDWSGHDRWLNKKKR